MASGNATTPILLNPNTPMAFLPPDVADQLQAVCYAYVAALAAYGWDWLVSIPEEFEIVRKAHLSWPNIAYFISRITTLGFCAVIVVFSAAQVDHCQALFLIFASFHNLSGPTTTILFLFRLRAVYNNSKPITFIFGFLWVGLFASYFLVLFGMKGGHIPGTRRCHEVQIPDFTTAPLIFDAVFDTLIFTAISYRLASHSAIEGNDFKTKARSFFRGEGLHSLSKALLQTGQVYYGIIACCAIITAVFMLSPSIPPQLQIIFIPTYVALSNAMGCRVYRSILLRLVEGGNQDLFAPQSQISNTVARHVSLNTMRNDIPLTSRDKVEPLQINIDIATVRNGDSYDLEHYGGAKQDTQTEYLEYSSNDKRL